MILSVRERLKESRDVLESGDAAYGVLKAPSPSVD